MTKTLALVLTGLSMLALSACAPSVKDGNSVEGTDFANPTTIIYNGEPLYCIEQGHGLSCDWVRYHLDNPATSR